MTHGHLIQFLSELGTAMASAGDATTFITGELQRLGTANGLQDLRVSAGPTLLILRHVDDGVAAIDLKTTDSGADLRLDQVADIYRLLEDAQAGRVNPQIGIERLRETLKRQPRYNAATRVAGLALISGGISLVLATTFPGLLVTLLLGALVGVIKEATGRVHALGPTAPVVSAATVATIGLLLIDAGLKASAPGLLIPPLAVFLPGAAITVAMIELSAGDIVSGGSRLAFGAARLLLLVLGIVIAIQAVDIEIPNSAPGVIPFVPLGPTVGVIAFTSGVCLHFGGPRGSFPWLLLVVGAAWGTQQAGETLLGSYLSAGLGGAVMVIVAKMVASRSGAPPLIVSYTPAFWLLVPSSIGLRSLTELAAQRSSPAALSDLMQMILTMIAVALGMLLGLLISGSREVGRGPVS